MSLLPTPVTLLFFHPESGILGIDGIMFSLSQQPENLKTIGDALSRITTHPLLTFLTLETFTLTHEFSHFCSSYLLLCMLGTEWRVSGCVSTFQLVGLIHDKIKGVIPPSTHRTDLQRAWACDSL